MKKISKKPIDQINDLIIENEALKKDNHKLRGENSDLRRRLTNLENSLEERIAKAVEKACQPLYAKITELEAEVTTKNEEISRLKTQINKDSSNSSKPPSTDGFKKIPNSREKTGKKSGGQKGHKGTTLTIPENLEELIEKGIAVKKTIDLTNGSPRYVSRWEVDLKTIVTYTEYRLAASATPFVFYGENVKVFSVLLSNVGLIAQRRLSEFLGYISHGLITPSDGTIEKFNREAAGAIDIEKYKDDLLNGKVIHVDETTMDCTERIDEKSGTLKLAEKTTFNVIARVYSNDTTTLLTIHPHKNDKGVIRDEILPRFHGILSHDHDRKYYKYGEEHATCCAHLSRELKGLYETYGNEWFVKFREFLLSLNDHKTKTESCEEEKLLEFEARYDSLLKEGEAILNEMQVKTIAYGDFNALLKRLSKYKDSYLRFIRDYEAPFTNNQAERDFRHCKTKEKVSGCFRTWIGINNYAKISSFISTTKKRKEDLYIAFKSLFVSKEWVPAE